MNRPFSSGGSIGTRSGDTIRYDNLSTRGYRNLMRKTLRHLTHVDEVFMFTDWRMWIETFDALEESGWRIRNMIVWDKDRMGMGMPWRNQHELIAYGKQSAAAIVNGRTGNVLRIPRSGNNLHPTEKPVDLFRKILGNTEATTIIDPFMGSGPVARACADLGRRYIGVEIVEEYVNTAIARLGQTAMVFK